MKKILLTCIAVACSLVAVAGELLIEAESLSQRGGWVLDQMGRIPAVGDTFVYDNRLSVRVTRVESTRVLEISVHQLDGAAEQTA